MLARFARNRRGAVAVEAALVTSFLLTPMLLGVWDVAQIGFRQAQVEEGLQDAVSYVAAGNSGNSSGIVAAAQSAYGSTISVSTSTACYCVSTSSSPTTPTAATCGGSCTGGADLEQFMSVSTSSTVTTPFSVPYLSSSFTVTSTGKVRTG